MYNNNSLLFKLISCIKERRLPWRLEQLYIKLLKLFEKEIDYFYNESFALSLEKEKLVKAKMAEIILNEFRVQSVVDFGCGTADILGYFEKRGIDVLGIDGSRANKRHSNILPKNFVLFDLRKKYKIKHKYDLCICLEVAEHIEEKYSDILVRNLVMSSSVVMFTAAPIGQSGTNHVNEKPYEWWVEKFKKYGYGLDKHCTEKMKKNLSTVPNLPEWYFRNLMIFRAGLS